MRIFSGMLDAGIEMTTDLYILGATIMEHYSESEMMFSLISEGIKLDPQNYELYVLLGNYYSHQNPDQAYLSYENALYLSITQNGTDSEDSIHIGQILDQYKQNSDINVHGVSFVILSYNTLSYTQLCIDSIRKHCFNKAYEIIVVDNASTDGSAQWLKEQPDIVLLENTENTGFPKGCNQGISIASKENDIFLLNSDTLMMFNSLYTLRMGLYENDKVGAAGAVTNYAGNQQVLRLDFDYSNIQKCVEMAKYNNIPQKNPYELKSMLIMFAMLIKRNALNQTGMLDESFSPGNYEDNDYGLRLLKKGYDCILCWNSFIFHFGSKSFNRSEENYKKLLNRNRQLFKNKWGFYPDYHNHVREEIIKLLTADDDGFSVLEAECGLGETLARIKYLYPNSEVHGLEIIPEVVDIGSRRFDITCGNIETISLPSDKKYDCIILAGVLEQLRAPEEVLAKIKSHLTAKGYILANIANLMNANAIFALLTGSSAYQIAGMPDKTHLRFYTKNEILDIFDNAGYEIQDMHSIVLPGESTQAHPEFFKKLLSIEGVAEKEQFDTYQFVVRAGRRH